ncbi:IS200/IS605 family transposase [Citrobacter sp. wls621]|uniref:IS200/IS605 family transposase n=1 Tax=Citrobacter sp. wls621 TaxID=2576430 RepID=UPI002017E7ED|nr:IS200/IS605 family transposase [Citrobacter sp. wls621]
MGDEKSFAHTRWNCKYHIVFAPKYRRQAFYGERRRAIGSILRKLCEWKNVRILEAECCADHIHMLVEIPPKMSVSGFMGYLKGKSSLMLYRADHIHMLVEIPPKMSVSGFMGYLKEKNSLMLYEQFGDMKKVQE